MEPLDGWVIASVTDFSMFGLITCSGSADLPTPESSGAGAIFVVAVNNSMHSLQ